MTKEQFILGLLNLYFEQVREAEKNMPFDMVAHTRNDRRLFYICVKSTINEQEEEFIKQQFETQIKTQKIEPAPLVLLTINDNTLQFGILLLWEDNRCVLNHSIGLKPFTDLYVRWLNIQLQAKRQKITSLPLEFVRIVKKIYLNSEDVVDGEIVYLRHLSQDYHMHQPTIITDEERFNRLLNGTPQEEYPTDDLDVEIFKRIKALYPQASVKSQLLLFDVELLNYRLYKNRKRQDNSVKIYLKTSQGIEKYINSINLECYYQPNVFRHTIIHNRNLDVCISEHEKEVSHLLQSYEPLSYMNI